MKKVLVITGTRADYGIYYPILKRIDSDSDLQLHLLVTGMHLNPQFGNTIDFIKNDGFRISAEVDILSQDTSHANMARSIGQGILGMTQAFESIQPDCVVVLGDRGEMLAAAITASHMNVPTLHLHGGEVSGSIDESVRHAISKLSHIHLTATEESKKRLIKMGEDPWRIHVVGAPRIETIESTALPDIQLIKKRYGWDSLTDYCLFIYHPVTTEQNAAVRELEVIFQALQENSQLSIICVMPNSDAGSSEIIDFYKRLRSNPQIHFITTFEQLEYLSILKHAAVMVGNSSSGIIEAASFRIPVINIGSRQNRRERSANILDIEADYNELKEALDRVKSAEFQNGLQMTNNVYGKKNTSLSIVQIIKRLNDYGDSLLQKTITY